MRLWCMASGEVWHSVVAAVEMDLSESAVGFVDVIDALESNVGDAQSDSCSIAPRVEPVSAVLRRGCPVGPAPHLCRCQLLLKLPNLLLQQPLPLAHHVPLRSCRDVRLRIHARRCHPPLHGLVEVGDQIIDVLDSRRNADEVVRQPAGFADLQGRRGWWCASRVLKHRYYGIDIMMVPCQLWHEAID